MASSWRRGWSNILLFFKPLPLLHGVAALGWLPAAPNKLVPARDSCHCRSTTSTVVFISSDKSVASSNETVPCLPPPCTVIPSLESISSCVRLSPPPSQNRSPPPLRLWPGATSSPCSLLLASTPGDPLLSPSLPSSPLLYVRQCPSPLLCGLLLSPLRSNRHESARPSAITAAVGSFCSAELHGAHHRQVARVSIDVRGERVKGEGEEVGCWGSRREGKESRVWREESEQREFWSRDSEFGLGPQPSQCILVIARLPFAAVPRSDFGQ
eukprot:2804993-Rhodomonas_salina.3